jgi:MSHA biogenesis protein MshG
MANFAYRGRDSAGSLVQGMAEAASAGALADTLGARGVVPLEINPAAAGSIDLAKLDLLGRGRVNRLDVMLFSRQLYTLLKAGVPIMRALLGLQESATSPAMSGVVKEVRESLDAGRELSASFARHPGVFSPFYLAMVRVGELTGRLEEIFLRLYEHLDFERFMHEQVRSALRYPTFVIAVMAMAIVVINAFVIPEFAKVYKGFNAKLPLLTELLIGFSDFMVESWPWLLGGAIGAVFLFRWWIATPDGRYRWHRFVLKLPIAGKIVRKATLARFARSFALASRSGVPVIQALSVVAQTVDNDYVAGKIARMRETVERGESVLRAAIVAGVFTPVVLQMVAVGEESGALDDMMSEIADMYQREVEYELKTLSAQIEPILILFLGVLVLILALGVFLPIWDLGRVALNKGAA